MLRLIALWSFGGLAAVWLFYPIAIAALAALVSRRRRALSPIDGDKPFVSVVIATRDSVEATRARILDCLETHYNLTRLEIVVAVDARSGTVAPDLTDAGDSVIVVFGDQPGGKAATLNAAVRASRGGILVFTDVRQRFDPDAIPSLIDALRAHGVGAVSGSLEIPGSRERYTLGERYWLFERWLREQEARLHSCVGVTGAIWAMRRELWLPLPDHLINDDMYTPMQILLRGQRVIFAREARAIETRRHEARDEFARKVRTLTGVIQICAWLPDVLIPTRNPVWVQFVFHKLLRLLTPYWVAAITLWLAVTIARGLELGVAIAVVLGAIAIAAAVGPRVRAVKRVWETVASGALLQAAAVIGTVNGLRGRWNVWAPSVGVNERK